MTADKSTKTDDILLNGESERTENQPVVFKPTTTNAATMTSIAIETDSSVNNATNGNGPQMVSRYLSVGRSRKRKLPDDDGMSHEAASDNLTLGFTYGVSVTH